MVTAISKSNLPCPSFCFALHCQIISKLRLFFSRQTHSFKVVLNPANWVDMDISSFYCFFLQNTSNLSYKKYELIVLSPSTIFTRGTFARVKIMKLNIARACLKHLIVDSLFVADIIPRGSPL
jgi:hypothetical protein